MQNGAILLNQSELGGDEIPYPYEDTRTLSEGIT